MMKQKSANPIQKAIEEGQVRVARAVLSWKYRKEGRPSPGDRRLDEDARKVTAEVRKVVVRGGKTVWNEFRNIYEKQKGKKEDPGE
ncbi:MAG: hypothetical protein DRH56_01505 [Deltaproteobacteria bacterium]|nr:MAG: hypothetical protein DRH56_01505 [Deltaproteobacteria bacterium]